MKMKIKYIIILLLSVAISSFASDSLKINATLYRLNTSTNLDKIISINKETGEIYESKGSSIKKNFLTDVKEDENLTFYANIQKVNDKDFIIRFPNSRNNVNVKIYDYKGSLVLEKEAYSDLNFKLSQDGIYFIVANDGKEIIKKSINTFAMEISTISNAYPILKPNTIYTFIGIKNGFRPDTLTDIDIANTDTLNFMVKDTFKYNFRSGTITISNLKVKFKIKSSSIGDVTGEKITYDTTIMNINYKIDLFNKDYLSDLSSYFNCPKCNFNEYTEDIISLCQSNCNGDHDNFKSNRLNASMFVNKDTIQVIRLAMDSNVYSGVDYGSRHYTNNTMSYNCTLSNLNINLSDNIKSYSLIISPDQISSRIINTRETESCSNCYYRVYVDSNEIIYDAKNPITLTLILNP
ncbi:MAG: hypothetical protein NTW25_06205 [Candidatus Kapabacteria bacterium]|nr:hypothetical protein [Candidatus Kapabacteria bacterium]